MVSVSLRQNPSSATDQNASAAALRPVSGTPLWARNDHAPGTPRPASPWDEWTIPPQPAALAEPRKPSPHPPAAAETREAAERPASSVPFRPWRIDFARPDVVEYPTPPAPASPITRRLLLLFGLAYLFIAALTSGLACTGYFTTASTGDTEPDADRSPDRPEEAAAPCPPPPSRHADSPGLHTRPDGTRYLVMPLPGDLADRFRDRVNAVHSAPAHAFGGGVL